GTANSLAGGPDVFSSHARRRPRGGVRPAVNPLIDFSIRRNPGPRLAVDITRAGITGPFFFGPAVPRMIPAGPKLATHGLLPMSPAARTWLILALTLSYLGTAHFALIHHSPALAATATATLALLCL